MLGSPLATSHWWDIVPTWPVTTTMCPGAPGGFGGCRCVYGRGWFWGGSPDKRCRSWHRSPSPRHRGTSGTSGISDLCSGPHPGIPGAREGVLACWGYGGVCAVPAAPGTGCRCQDAHPVAVATVDKCPGDTWRGVAPSTPQLFVPTGAAFGAPTSALLTLRLLWGPGETPPPGPVLPCASSGAVVSPYPPIPLTLSPPSSPSITGRGVMGSP